MHSCRSTAARLILFFGFSALAVDAQSAPAEVGTIQFTGATTVVWPADAGSAGYHFYRGTPAAARTGDFGTCVAGSVQGLTVDSSDAPPVGTVYLYHVSAFDSSGEGTLGVTSSGSPRIPSTRCVPARRDFDLTTAGSFVDGVEDGASARRNPSVASWNSRREDTGVELHTGEFVLESTDLRLGGRGTRDPEDPGTLPLEFIRSYSSQVTFDGPLGPGWDFAYDARLRPSGSNVLFYDGHGRRELFTRLSATRFLSPRGLYAVLIQNGSGSFTLRDPDGLLSDFHAFDGSNKQGALEALTDRNGDRITLAYDNQGLLTVIVDVLGRSVTLQYDANGRLTTVGDSTGRSVVYAYDAAGRLTSARSPLVTGTPNGNDFPSGKTSTYRYDTVSTDPLLATNLVAIVAPNEGPGGTPFLQNVYGTTPGSFAFDRVIQQSIGGTNASGVPAGGTQTFAYTVLNPFSNPFDPTIPRRQVTWTDRDGNERVLVHNALGNALSRLERTNRDLRPGEGDYLTTASFNIDGEITQKVLPQGNREIRIYDTGSSDRSRQGNLLTSIRSADPVFAGGRGDGHGGELADEVTTYVYDPVYNQVASMTDPRGNDGTFVPPNGGPASPARYTRTWFFDYQESDPAANGLNAYAARFGLSLSGVSFSLGDLNGDGQTLGMAGNPVATDAPPVTLDPGSHQAAIGGGTQQLARSLVQYNAHGQVIATIDPEGNRNDYQYYPETDPDGDGVASAAPPDGRTLDATTGGSLHDRIMDSVPGAGRDNNTDPAPRAVRNDFLYDVRGALTDFIDGRGIRTRAIVNALGQPVEIRRAAATADAAGPLGDPATGRGETGLTPYAYRSRFAYDANDNLVRHESEDAGLTRGVGPFVTTTWSLDILDDPVSSAHDMTAASQAITALGYDPDQQLILLVKPEGNSVEWAYDERGLVLSHTRGASGPRGGAPATRLFEYDGNRSGTKVIDARGGEHDFLHDGLDRLARTIDPVGNTSEISRDPAGQVTRLLRRGPAAGPTPPDRSGSTNVDLSDTRDGWDERGRLFRIDQALFVPVGTSLARPASLSEGPLTPGDGQISTFLEYDRASRRTFIVEDSGATTRWDFDGLGQPLKLTDASSSTWLWTYDGNRNGVEIVQTEVPTGPPGLAPVSFASTAFYDSLDRLGSHVDPIGNTEWWQYDSLDAIVGSADALGPVTGTILRRSPGPPQTVGINMPGNVTRIGYDALSNEIRTDRILTASRQGNGTWTPTPDTSNIANPDGLITVRTTWDRNGLPLSSQDDAGHVTATTYDNLDRPVLTQADDQTVETVQYDPEDLPVGRFDANGTFTSSSFDPARRLVARSVSPAAGVEGTTLQQFQNDGLGRITYASDNNGFGSADDVWDALAYDSLGRILEETQGTNLGTFSTDTGWLAEGLRQSITYPSGRQVYYQFDSAERMSYVSDFQSGLSASFEYYGLNRVHTCRYGNGARATRLNDSETSPTGFDGARRTTLLRYLGPGSTLLAGFQLRYDRIGQVTGVRRPHHPGPSGSFNGDTFTFDSGRRLIAFQNAFLSASFAPVGSPTETLSLQLDGQGNVVTFAHNGVSLKNTPNNLNEYDEPQSGGSRIDDGIPDDIGDIVSTPSPDGLNLAHDKSGNEIDSGLYQVAFDFLDRPVRVTRKSDLAPIAAYAYDPLGRRVLRSVTNSGSLDRNQVLLYGGYPLSRLLEERDGSGSTTREVVFGAGPNDRLFQTSAAFGPAYLMEDPDGSEAGLLYGFSASILERTTYDPFGRPQFRSASNAVLLDPSGVFQPESQYGVSDLFRGLRYDPEMGRRSNGLVTDIAGTYLVGTRPLSALTGRWSTRGSAHAWDPLSGNGNEYSVFGRLSAPIGPFELIPAPSDNPLSGIETFSDFVSDTGLRAVFASFVLEDDLEKKLKDLSEKLKKAADFLSKLRDFKEEHGKGKKLTPQETKEAEEKLGQIHEQLKKINDLIEKLKKAKELKQTLEEAGEDPIAVLKGVNILLKESVGWFNKVPGGGSIIGVVVGVYIQALDSTIKLLGLVPRSGSYVWTALDLYRRGNCKGEADPIECIILLTDKGFPEATDKDREEARRAMQAELLKDTSPVK
jgi:YD repeat-containing protein